MKSIFTSGSAIKDLKKVISIYNQQAIDAASFIKEIENGNLDSDIPEHLLESDLGKSLASIKEHLKKIAGEEQERSWLSEGLAKFSDILRNKRSFDLHELSNDILTNLVNYVGANQGGLFILKNDEGQEGYLQMLSCYAYDKKKLLAKRIEIGEGLLGQCVLDKEVTYLKQTPTDYINITSGLGEAAPREIFITPLLINDQIFGVLELASFLEFTQNKIDFIKRLSENIAASIKNAQESEQIRSLLNSSQQQAEELRAQEEEMRQNMEELQATQEEIERKSNEISRTSAEMRSVFNGINATMATIEFTSDGTVLAANENFLKTMKYRIEDIRGKHHRKFVPDEILNAIEYQTFWSRLASGESFTGVFNRITSEGKTVWLNAIYNPITDASGKVIKVIKFASDISEQQEMIAESKGILGGINATMATIEFTADGKILNANSNFLKTMGYSMNEIVNNHHRIFVPDDVVNGEEYKSFWTNLASGKSMTGVFKRVSKSGKTVWLNAIYNPILNSSNQVIKVIKFATDITASQASPDIKASIAA